MVRAIKKFENGSRVHIKIDPSKHNGMPDPKFHEKTGEAVGKRGRAYILRVADGNSTRVVITPPEHLAKEYSNFDQKLMSVYKKQIRLIDKKESKKQNRIFIGFHRKRVGPCKLIVLWMAKVCEFS